jgi:arylsulfatase A-like enzyme
MSVCAAGLAIVSALVLQSTLALAPAGVAALGGLILAWRGRRALRRAGWVALRWSVPSLVAGSVGAIVAGAFEVRAMDSMFGGLAAAGFLGFIAVPMLVAISAAIRLLWKAWQPGELGWIEEGGGAPWLAGWLGVIVLGAAALGWAMFQGTWLLSSWTAFKPLAMSYAEPLIAIVTMCAIVVGSRPLARALAAITRAVDRRWQRRGHQSMLTPKKIVAAGGIKVAVIGYLFWRFVVRPRIPLDVTVLYPPAAALGALAVTHAVWARLTCPRRRVVGPVIGGAAALVLGCALFAWRERPSLTLTIWGERPLAGFAIDRLLDLDAIRGRVSLAEFRPAEHPGARHPDIVLVTIDTVRADHTPPYGGSADMPVLKQLGERGVVFEWAFSPSNVTRRSIPSMIIGLGPDRVRGRVVGWALRVDPRHVLIAERLRAGGYETAGFMCCEGFWGHEMRTGLERGLEHLEIEPNGLALARRARAWLDEREKTPNGKPLFLWMHILEPHNWAMATGEPRSEDERRRQYDRALIASDTMVTTLLGAFSERAPDKAPIVIVSADHGEGLGDHGQPFHSTDLYNSQTHVPLVIAGPGIKPGRIAETVSLTDLTPSLLDLAGFVPPTGPSIDGRSFADLATGKRIADPEAGTAFAAMIHDRSNPGGVTAMIKGRWKLIETPSGLELYDTRADPAERTNLMPTLPGASDPLRKLLLEHREAAARSPFE